MDKVFVVSVHGLTKAWRVKFLHEMYKERYLTDWTEDGLSVEPVDEQPEQYLDEHKGHNLYDMTIYGSNKTWGLEARLSQNEVKKMTEDGICVARIVWSEWLKDKHFIGMRVVE
jgi:hypothetical protein